MESADPNLLVCLLALRQHGGTNVPAKQDLFAKGLKREVMQGIDHGLIASEKISVTTVGKNGKSKSTKIDVLSLTEAGISLLQKSANPEAFEIARQGDLLAFRNQLDADREKLRKHILDSLTPSNKANPKSFATDLAALTKAVDGLKKRLEKLESLAQGPNANEILLRIDEGFAQLSAKLGGTAEISLPAQRQALSLREVLRESYEDLRGLLEYQDGPVPLPRLYHQSRNRRPNLSLAEFHSELLSLREERLVDLMVLNEVRTASEPEKGIRQGDNLYYFVVWK